MKRETGGARSLYDRTLLAVDPKHESWQEHSHGEGGGCPNSAGFVRPCVCFGRSIQNVKASPKDRVCGPRFPLRACVIHWGWTCPKSTRPFDNPRKVLLLWSERIESHLKVEHWKGHTLLGCLGLTNIVLDTVTKRRMLSTANHAYLISTIPLFLIGSR